MRFFATPATYTTSFTMHHYLDTAASPPASNWATINWTANEASDTLLRGAPGRSPAAG